MKGIVVVLAAILLGCGRGDAGAQGVDGDAAERGDRIVANLKLQFPSLRDVELSVDSLRASDVDGLDKGNLNLPDGRVQPFLVDASKHTLYLLAAPPIDVSRPTHEALSEISSAVTDLHESLMAEIDDLPRRGSPDAPVTMIEFSDFQCPYCARAAATVQRLLEDRQGQLNLVYLHYPLPNHPWARPAAIASECAAQQSDEAFWHLHDEYFAEQRSMTEANVVDRSRGFLTDTGIDVAAWEACTTDASSPEHAAAVEVVDRGMALAQAVGVTGTPHFVINGRAISGARPAADFDEVIEQSLRDAGTAAR